MGPVAEWGVEPRFLELKSRALFALTSCLMVNPSFLMSENIQHHILMTWTIKRLIVCAFHQMAYFVLHFEEASLILYKCYNFFWLLVNTSIYSCPESSLWVLISIKHRGIRLCFNFVSVCWSHWRISNANFFPME